MKNLFHCFELKFVIFRYGGMFISKLTHKSKTQNIDSFKDLLGTNIQIIVKGDHFVEDFFKNSESQLISEVKGLAMVYNQSINSTMIQIN